MLSNRLMFIGHISMDEVENVNGVSDQPGGAALYAAMAARTLSSNVTLVSAVGDDYKFPEVLKLINSNYVKIYRMPSTRFHIRYNKRWIASYLGVFPGAGSKITTRSIKAKMLTPRSLLHISPMRATKVKRIFAKIKTLSPESKISINTWIGYINEGRRSREILRELASKTDFFILNDSEAKALAQTDSISAALRLLRAKMLIVTLGSLGAIISGEETTMQLIPALSIPSERIVDTTGAGDVWCGAFLATYDLTENLTKAVSVASIISSMKCSDWGFKSLENLRFKKPEDVIEFILGLRDGSLQKRMTDYVGE